MLVRVVVAIDRGLFGNIIGPGRFPELIACKKLSEFPRYVVKAS
jgi:hypothetical protein